MILLGEVLSENLLALAAYVTLQYPPMWHAFNMVRHTDRFTHPRFRAQCCWQIIALKKQQHEQLSELNKIAQQKAEEAAAEKKATQMLVALKSKSDRLSER